MNIIAATGIVDTFHQFGFDHVNYESLWVLADHYSSANSRLLVLTSFSSMDDFYLGFLLFGQTDLPTYFVTDFPNPFASSCFANNVHVLPCNPALKNHTQRIIKHFRNNKNFVLVLAMHDAQKARTHSGYMYIAQELQLQMIVAGFDHFQRSFFVAEKRVRPPKPQTELVTFRLEQERLIMDQMRQICPQNPAKATFFNTLEYQNKNPTFDASAIRLLDSDALCKAIAGNRITTSEIGVIIAITVAIVIVILLIYFLTCDRKKNTQTQEKTIH